MKKIFIFTIGLIISLAPFKTNALETRFHAAEYITNTYIDRLTPNKKLIYYQHSQMIRENGTNRLAYCIDPFKAFNNASQYTPDKNLNLTKEQIERISLLSYYGYNYQSHQEEKWYSITQLLIWQTVEPKGRYYFTDRLNGDEIFIYQKEMNELNDLVTKSKIKPSLNNNYNIVYGENLIINDNNNVLNSYIVTSNNAYIKDNKLYTNNLSTGNHTITIKKKDNHYNYPLLFYKTSVNQNLVTVGNLKNENINININVQETKIKINKLDKDTNNKNSSGEGILQGAKYQLYNQENKLIKTIEINNNKEALENNIPYGTYYLKEIEPGKGYTLDKNIYTITLNKDNPNITLDLKNEIIKAKVKINKTYDQDSITKPEPNIKFAIYDINNKLVKILTTDNNGSIETYLPYGTYTIKQLNTTEGYKFIEPFTINIKNEKDLTYNLTNYKIEVPNTYIPKYKNILKLIYIIIYIIIYV